MIAPYAQPSAKHAAFCRNAQDDDSDERQHGQDEGEHEEWLDAVRGVGRQQPASRQSTLG